jgi:cation diffusion facilitator CzcD-associated flavoprotein CzcO
MVHGAQSRPKVVIIGAGFGGLAVGLELARSGYHDFVILEKAKELGGVWRENTYPGAACDVPSPYYSFSFEPNPEWPQRYSSHSEIKAYMNRVVDKYDLRSRIRFGTEVTAASFDANAGRWRIETNKGETFEADVFVPATGQLSRPSVPEIKGRDVFAGRSFHSAEWDHAYELAGKRIAVIGTGASAIQFVPQIQPKASKLTLFQRTAPYVVMKPDTTYGRVHRFASKRLPLLAAERFVWWSFCEFLTLGALGNRAVAKYMDFMSARQRNEQIKDPALRAKVTPDYPVGCKRLLFADNYYPALAQPNVHLETGKITELTRGGVRTADGVEHEVDVIIYGTGFKTQDLLAPMVIRGLQDRDLRAVWKDGARAYLGMAVPGFPNMFIMYGPNTNLGFGSIIYMLECQARYVRQAVEHLAARPGRFVEVREEVEAAYDREIQGRLSNSVWTSCVSWYRNASGRVSNNWPGTVSEYNRRTRHVEWRDYAEGVRAETHVSAPEARCPFHEAAG